MAVDVRVVVAILLSGDGQHVLLTQRKPSQDHAGLWEFPGGKIAEGETEQQALRRELEEELGIDLKQCFFKTRFPYHYPDKNVELNVWQVTGWESEPVGNEGQNVQWFPIQAIMSLPLVPADAGIARGLNLPSGYAITPDLPEDLEYVIRQIENQYLIEPFLLQIRFMNAPEASEYLLQYARQRNWPVLVSRNIELANKYQTGLHLSSAQLQAFDCRPVAADQLLGASVHDELQMRRAIELGVDFVVLSPVQKTGSHPSVCPLGWASFESLVNRSPIPVYALGGMAKHDIHQAQRLGGQGIAGISCYFPDK